MVRFGHDAPGTDEQLWQQWGGLDDLEPLVDLVPQYMVVLAAHPDDETLGAGGLIAHCAANGTQVDVVVATAGEASHPRSPTKTPSQLAELRAHEVRAAVHTLAPNVRLHLMGLPDGRLADHQARVVQKLSGLLDEEAWPHCENDIGGLNQITEHVKNISTGRNSPLCPSTQIDLMVKSIANQCD